MMVMLIASYEIKWDGDGGKSGVNERCGAQYYGIIGMECMGWPCGNVKSEDEGDND